MGRSEALTVAALGRSPYDDVVIQPTDPGQQRFDDRGHPVNAKSRRSINDFIRASNEVLKAAGIIEEDSEVRARDQAYQKDLEKETQLGIRLVEVGHLALVTGLWGVTGLRRRILLYNSYATADFVQIVRYEASQYSILHRDFAGAPSMLAFRALDWLSLIMRALITGTEDDSCQEISFWRQTTWKAVHGLITYASIPYNVHAILQQVNIISTSKPFPNFQAFIPFTASSLLHLPSMPLSWATSGRWVLSLTGSIAPFLLVLSYHKLATAVSYSLFSSIYAALPKPVNRNSDGRSSFLPSDGPRTNSAHGSRTGNAPDAERTASRQQTEVGSGSTQDDGPTQHAATLRALEGQPSNSAVASDREISDDEAEAAQTTLISFDVEPTGIPESAAGPWSAELRNTNDPPSQPKDDVVYHITAFTLLPPLLAAEGLSYVLTNVALLPLETAMVRAVVYAYRRNEGLPTTDLLPLVSLCDFTWRRAINLVTVKVLDVAVTGIVWAGLIVLLKKYGYSELGRSPPRSRPVDDEDLA